MNRLIERKGLLRAGGMIGIVGVLATSALMAEVGAAAAADTTCNKHVELEIANNTGEDLAIDGRFSTDVNRGRTESKERNGVPAFPGNAVETANGEVKKYALNFIGETDWKEKIGFIYEFNNFMNVQASNKKDSSVSQATLTHTGRVYGESEANKVAVINEGGNEKAYAFALQEQGSPGSGFAKKYRLNITKNTPGMTADPISGTATKITGNAAEKPVWKIRVNEHTRRYSELPDDVRVDPIKVSGLRIPGIGSTEVGKVLPAGQPKVDRSTNSVTYPETTFYWENPEGGPEYTHLQLSAGPVAGPLVNLAAAPQPGLSQSDVTAVEVSTSTGMPVTANGVAQEALKVKIKASGQTVSPDHRPELMGLYDNVYFRDTTGKLLTGMYEEATGGGYTSVSTNKGGYVNALRGMQGAADESRVYLSTTKKTAPVVKAHLGITKKQQSTDVRVERTDATDSIAGSGRTGLVAGKGLADQEAGAYHHYNGERPEGSILTRYVAVPTVASLPIKNPFSGHFTVQNNGSDAQLNHSRDLDKVANLHTHVVNAAGTYVVAPNFAV